jgi:hypothetical protein
VSKHLANGELVGLGTRLRVLAPPFNPRNLNAMLSNSPNTLHQNAFWERLSSGTCRICNN